ncbi:alpha/beta hydrolase [Herbidospora galbida]|uniref:Alpha/beta hydrolase n=1 Tax=Herbidospora galbida TaxID=2575442 RepID=A0A4U3MIR6_9ACTN|nr:alpha/beta hydrolase [Herbidospora galbida]TKK89265.1 alpha/beta hydrolase [Herbidospora galbida]
MNILTVGALVAGLVTAPTPALPAPTGPHPVGALSLHLMDKSRSDPWVPASGPRQLMVTVWYPALSSKGKRFRYVTTAESANILARVPGADDIPPGVLATTRTHARSGAPMVRRTLPLVVLSPGFSFPRATLTSLGEDLASRGYLVAAVEHTYESVGTTFPDGHTTTCVVCERQQTKELGAQVSAGRVRDLTFVIDQLKKRFRVGGVAVAGHSMGGNAAVHTLAARPSIRAAVNFDGSLLPDAPPLDRPVLLMGAVRIDATWPPVQAKPKTWLEVTGTDHSSFTDYALLRGQVGLPSQPLDGTRAIEITRAYTAWFLDRHLRGRQTPEPEFPEVRRRA